MSTRQCTSSFFCHYELFRLEKGIEKGKAEGLAEGIAKGKAEGIAEGIAKEQRHIAAQLKKRGVVPEMIAQCTGLSIEEIEML